MSGLAYSKAVRPLAYDLHEPAKSKFYKDQSPLIFLHGLFGSKRNNRAISKVLARDLGRYVYAIDLRNHGESPHAQRHDYPAMATDVLAFIKDNGLRDPTIIGHSMGAKTAMTLALWAPDSLASLIAVDNAPVHTALNDSFALYIRAMSEIEAANITRQSEADDILRRVEPSLAIRQFLLANLYRPDSEDGRQRFRVPLQTLARSLHDLGDFPFFDPSKQKFEKPTLFIRGTNSNYVTDEMLPSIEQFFPKFRLIDIDAGHWVISEQPEAFHQAVVNFLQS
ncbi:hypothetical protein CDD82_1297 [Ophiocordyceps australis]|uniref:AB hydrolase-1 domain-containing protein n=1 Tax=Ophiocordyceps australis TaxID=1399860 RepID=A0A2C5YJW5_9HYPO|nr:hypothetical protein CDD82_1297 [Ophiocordyceps australis]